MVSTTFLAVGLLAAACTMLVARAAPLTCTFQVGGQPFDFSTLSRDRPFVLRNQHDDIHPTDFYDYYLNFCSTFTMCKANLTGSAVQVAAGTLGQATESCRLAANWAQSAPVIAPLDGKNPSSGVSILVGGGQTYSGSGNTSCKGVPRSVMFKLGCDCFADDIGLPSRLTFSEEGSCGPYIFTGSTYSACPVGSCKFNPDNPQPQNSWCQFNGQLTGTYYDLNPLMSPTDYYLRNQSDLDDPVAYDYRLNVCGYVNYGCKTRNESVAQFPTRTRTGDATCKNCGIFSGDSRLEETPDGVRMTYLYGAMYGTRIGCQNRERRSILLLTCDCNGPTTSNGMKFTHIPRDTGDCDYVFFGKTALACAAGACTGSGSRSTHKSLSGGWIFIIVLFVLTAVYFLGGFIIKSAKGARGLAACPNNEFWANFYSLVADGIYFLAHGCKPRVSYTGMDDSDVPRGVGTSSGPAAVSAPAPTTAPSSSGYGSL